MTADEDACELAGIHPSSIRALPIVPTIKPLKITGGADCAFTRDSRVDFGTDTISARILFARGSALAVLVTIQVGTEKGSYDLSVDGIGGVSFEVK